MLSLSKGHTQEISSPEAKVPHVSTYLIRSVNPE